MSEYAKIPLGEELDSFEISPQFNIYSRVEIYTGKKDDDGNEIIFGYGNYTGRTLKIDNPWGSAQQARDIYEALRESGFRYQPYKATGAYLNPAAELGDGVVIGDTYSGVYRMTKTYGSMVSAEMDGPEDEEINHEYPYEAPKDRAYTREIADAQAQIKINALGIESSVKRTDEDWVNTQSFITQTAEDIQAFVKSEGGSGAGTTSFGWKLTSTAWTLNSGGSEVFKASKDGVVISGKITAKSGFIGNGTNGFIIESSAIHTNGKGGRDDGNDGVYIGTTGIGLGKSGAFKVTSSGAVTCSNLTISGGSIKITDAFKVTTSGDVTCNKLTAKDAKLTGTLTIGSSTINADTLRSGASAAASGASGWNSTKKTVDNNKKKWNGAATDAADALTKCDNMLTGNAIFSKLRFTNVYLGGKWRSLSRTPIEINGTNYYVVTST